MSVSDNLDMSNSEVEELVITSPHVTENHIVFGNGVDAARQLEIRKSNEQHIKDIQDVSRRVALNEDACITEAIAFAFKK